MTIDEAKQQLAVRRDEQIRAAHDAYERGIARIERAVDEAFGEIVGQPKRSHGTSPVTKDAIRDVIRRLPPKFRRADVRRVGGWTGSAECKVIGLRLHALKKSGEIRAVEDLGGSAGYVYEVTSALRIAS
jgi:hypothetical protein